MVDALVLGTSGAICGGSSPLPRTEWNEEAGRKVWDIFRVDLKRLPETFDEGKSIDSLYLTRRVQVLSRAQRKPLLAVFLREEKSGRLFVGLEKLLSQIVSAAKDLSKRCTETVSFKSSPNLQPHLYLIHNTPIQRDYLQYTTLFISPCVIFSNGNTRTFVTQKRFCSTIRHYNQPIGWILMSLFGLSSF